MIKLDNVSIKCLGDKYYDYYDYIKDYELVTIQDLIDMISISPEDDWGNLIDSINGIKAKVIESNKEGRKPITYGVSEYEDRTLNYTDTLCTGYDLLLGSPLSGDPRFSFIKNESIADIKSDLRTTDETGENFLVAHSSMIKHEDIPEILRSLELYQKQLIRLSHETRYRDMNVFSYLIDLRKSVIREKYAQIIYFLIDNENLLWGRLTREEKRLLVDSIANDNVDLMSVHNLMIRVLGNYISLSDANKLATNDLSPLKRFLAK